MSGRIHRVRSRRAWHRFASCEPRTGCGSSCPWYLSWCKPNDSPMLALTLQAHGQDWDALIEILFAVYYSTFHHDLRTLTRPKQLRVCHHIPGEDN